MAEHGQLALLTRYDETGASSRLRYYEYLPYLEAGGYQARVHPFFPSRYLRRLYRSGRKSRLDGLFALGRRLLLLPLLPSRLLLEYELLPFVAAKTELRWLKSRRFILNFDDNVWEKYRGNRRLEQKYDHLAEAAAGVVVANDFLARKVENHNRNWIKIPTVIDLDRYRRERGPKRDKLTLCWIGTPVTYDYLECFAPTLQAMARAVDFELLVIAGRQLAERAIPGVSMCFEDWSEAREAALISSCHLGIMPLPDDEFARGKSAYKLIQYLGAGLPVIASPVGENRVVVDDTCGLLPEDAAGWVAALELLADPARRAALKIGVEARAEEYSLQKYGPILLDFVRKSFHDR